MLGTASVGGYVLPSLAGAGLWLLLRSSFPCSFPDSKLRPLPCSRLFEVLKEYFYTFM